jgi:hypothetical protein
MYLIILRKTKTCNFTKIGHVLCNDNKFLKDLTNAFWIGIEFTKILGQFKQKEICRFIHTTTKCGCSLLVHVH